LFEEARSFFMPKILVDFKKKLRDENPQFEPECNGGLEPQNTEYGTADFRSCAVRYSKIRIQYSAVPVYGFGVFRSYDLK
jgi:hypothetical protein